MMRSIPVIFAAAGVLICTAAAGERDFSTKNAAGAPPGIFLEAGPLVLTLTGRAQLHVGLVTGQDALLSDGDAAEEEGFRLRRARLGMTAQYDNELSVGVVVDLLESNGSALHEAYIGWENPVALVYGGLVKAPMSRSALLSSQHLQLSDRALGVRGMAPFQQLGVMAGGKVWGEKIRILTGFFNGMERADTFAGGYERIDPKVGNRFGGFAIAGRLDIEPMGLLGAGVADLGHSKDPLIGVGGGVLFNAGETVKSLALSGDLALKWMGISLLAEYIMDQSEPQIDPSTHNTIEAKTKRSALIAQLGYTAIANTLDVAARFEMIDENKDVEDEGDYQVISGCASLYVGEGHFKVQLSYQHRMEQHGKKRDNDVFALQAEGRF